MPKNRYARAQARARYRKPKRRNSSLPWTAAIGVIVVVGVALIIVSRSDNTASAAPALGDHWHAQFSVNVCGEFQPPAPEFEVSTQGERTGIHTHGDGVIHIHPFTSAETGDNATVGKFLDYQGYDINDDSFELWEPIGVKRNGDTCPDGQPGKVRWAVNGKERNGNVSDYHPEDGDQIVVAFIPDGQEIPPAPDVTQTQD
jgi:hypothetical protein